MAGDLASVFYFYLLLASCFPKWWSYFTFPSAAMESSSCFTSSATCGTTSLCFQSFQGCVVTYISPMTNGVVYLLRCKFLTHIIFQWLLNLLSIVYQNVILFFLLSYKRFCMSQTESFVRYMFTHLCSHAVSTFSFNSVFGKETHFNFDEVQLMNLNFLIACTFVSF